MAQTWAAAVKSSASWGVMSAKELMASFSHGSPIPGPPTHHKG